MAAINLFICLLLKLKINKFRTVHTASPRTEVEYEPDRDNNSENLKPPILLYDDVFDNETSVLEYVCRKQDQDTEKNKKKIKTGKTEGIQGTVIELPGGETKENASYYVNCLTETLRPEKNIGKNDTDEGEENAKQLMGKAVGADVQDSDKKAFYGLHKVADYLI